MSILEPLIQLAGAGHLGVVAANALLPKRLNMKENVARLSPILRQVFLVHWWYVLVVLLIFASLCFFFAGELTGGSPLGRFLSGSMAAFWWLRIVLQVAYYDREVRRANRGLDALYLAALFYFAVVFSAAAAGGAVR